MDHVSCVFPVVLSLCHRCLGLLLMYAIGTSKVVVRRIRIVMLCRNVLQLWKN
uniref:Uncharacterized protein n=1 Tax=Arundo donax TaxID=35708 RepID=A0A0A9D2Y8_ARUDO